MEEIIRKRKSERNGPDEGEMMQLLCEQAHATGDRQGRIVDDPCYNTMSKAKDMIGAVKNQPQVISEAIQSGQRSSYGLLHVDYDQGLY